MLLERNKHSESAYIGEELFSDPQRDRLDKCMVVEQTIAEGDFSLDEALEAYQVRKEEYEDYIARKSNANIFISIIGNTVLNTSVEAAYAMPMYMEVFAKMIESSFNERLHSLFDQRLTRIKHELFQISKGIEELNEQG